MVKVGERYQHGAYPPNSKLCNKFFTIMGETISEGKVWYECHFDNFSDFDGLLPGSFIELHCHLIEDAKEMVTITSDLMTEIYEFINATNGPLARKIWEQVRTLPPPTQEKSLGIKINGTVTAKNINIGGNQVFRSGNLTED